MSSSARAWFEAAFEWFLFNSRLIVLLAVLGSLMSSVLMFVHGASIIVHAAVEFFTEQEAVVDHHERGSQLSISLIASVDNFLFATVLLIFAMGIYELFISKIDPASRTSESRPNWLQIQSLDDLKGAVGKVILMILIVRLFESAVRMKYEKPLDLLYLGLGVVFVAVALYLQHLGHKDNSDHGSTSYPPPGHAGHAPFGHSIVPGHAVAAMHPTHPTSIPPPPPMPVMVHPSSSQIGASPPAHGRLSHPPTTAMSPGPYPGPPMAPMPPQAAFPTRPDRPSGAPPPYAPPHGTGSFSISASMPTPTPTPPTAIGAAPPKFPAGHPTPTLLEQAQPWRPEPLGVPRPPTPAPGPPGPGTPGRDPHRR